MSKHKEVQKQRELQEARRAFLRVSSAATISSLLLPIHTLGRVQQPQAECDPTTADIEGPYYKAGSPHKVRIADTSELGTRLFITGVATATDCTTPINNVLLDIWQANKDGVYDTSDSYRLRGKVTTDAQGKYSFETILPGNYQNRPRHIHLMLTAPNQTPVITQLYFEGDPDIAADPWASEASAKKRIIPLQQDSTQQLHGVFNLVLGTTTDYSEGKTVIPKPARLLNTQPHPIGASTVLYGEVFEPCTIELNIVDINGVMVRPLLRQRVEVGTFAAQWDGSTQTASRAAAGTYICQLLVNNTPVDYLRIILR